MNHCDNIHKTYLNLNLLKLQLGKYCQRLSLTFPSTLAFKVSEWSVSEQGQDAFLGSCWKCTLKMSVIMG